MGKLSQVAVLVSLFGCSQTEAGKLEPIELQIEAGGFEDLVARVESYRGKPLLLNWWAIWCVPCVAEQPELLEVARELRERGGEVIGISYDMMLSDVSREDTMVELKEFMSERRVDIPVFLFDDTDPFAISQHFGLPGPIPVTLALDAEGNVVDRQEGQADRARLLEMMDNALGG